MKRSPGHSPFKRIPLAAELRIGLGRGKGRIREQTGSCGELSNRIC